MIDKSIPTTSLPQADKTKKLPPQPNPLVRGTYDYLNVKGSCEPDGQTNADSLFVSDPKHHFEAHVDKFGGYGHTENTETKISARLNNTVGYNYGKGQSNHQDGHQDNNSEGNTNNNTKNDHKCSAGGDSYHGAGGDNLTGTGGNGSLNNDTGGNKYVTTSGDHITQHDGHIHTNIKGDAVDAVVGNKYTITQKDYGIHVQGGGNMDFKIDGGKFQVNSGSDLILKSSSKIILQVGGSSITITPNDITINSGGTVNIKGSGDIITKGQTTKLQDGGSQVVTEAGPSSVVFAKV